MLACALLPHGGRAEEDSTDICTRKDYFANDYMTKHRIKDDMADEKIENYSPFENHNNYTTETSQVSNVDSGTT